MWRKYKCKETLTGQNGASLALLLHVSMFLACQSEGRLKHKAVDVVMSLKVCPLVLLFFLVKVGHHVRHLNVGKLGVQVFGIDLFLKDDKQEIEIISLKSYMRKKKPNLNSYVRPNSVTYLIGVLDHLYVVRSKLVWVEFE